MFGLGGTELLIIGGIVLLLFGPAKLPALAGSVGKSIKEFRRGVKAEEPPADEQKPSTAE